MAVPPAVYKLLLTAALLMGYVALSYVVEKYRAKAIDGAELTSILIGAVLVVMVGWMLCQSR